MGDKCVSVGEKSTLLLLNSLCTNSITGLASKDLSSTIVIGCEFSSMQNALQAYRKKQLFGGGKIDVFATLLINNAKDLVADQESEIYLEYSSLNKPGTNNVTFSYLFDLKKKNEYLLKNLVHELKPDSIGYELDRNKLKRFLKELDTQLNGKIPSRPGILDASKLPSE